MVNYTMDNNRVHIAGKINSPLLFSHEMFGEGFYNFDLVVPRLSNYEDILPVTVSERLLNKIDLYTGIELVVEGQFRSYNKYVDGSNKLILIVFARDIKIKDEEIKNPNQIYLNGFICKEPVYRITPFNREIADLLIAVNRPYNKSDYIPTIAWGRNARFCQQLTVGDQLKIWGRIQSRNYQKKLANGELINKTAYEVSVTKMELVKDRDK